MEGIHSAPWVFPFVFFSNWTVTGFWFTEFCSDPDPFDGTNVALLKFPGDEGALVAITHKISSYKLFILNIYYKFSKNRHIPINVSLLDDSLNVVDGILRVLWSGSSTLILTLRFESVGSE